MSKFPADALVPLREPGSHCQAISPFSNAVKVAIHLVSWTCVGLGCASFATASQVDASNVRLTDVVTLSGAQLGALQGYPIESIGVVACDHRACRPIPMQIDERDASGAWVLDGETPNSDAPARILDADDELVFMAADVGETPAASNLPAAAVAFEVAVVDPLSGGRAWAYVLGYAGAAPRAGETYVRYDAARDRFGGAHVSFGFDNGVPTFMSIGDDAVGANILDRMKVRAAASLLWGWLRFRRDEDDLVTESVTWHAGPIRVIRYQTQSIQLGWGIRAPAFRSYTYFYRDFAELGVGLRLRRPATFFLGDILIEVVLDFRDLRGWRLELPGSSPVVDVGDVGDDESRTLNASEATSFVLRGPKLNLMYSFNFSESLQTVRKHFVYRDDAQPDPPEAVVGQRPGVGYALEQWEAVGPGEHTLTASSYALPSSVSIEDFLHARERPLAIAVRPLQLSS